MPDADHWTNGVMIDCVRVTERYDDYLKLIPRLARWGYDTLFWHFTDDEGCALRLASHPELASRYALSRRQMERLIGLAARHGIKVVPEVESLGHCRWITHLPRYAHLSDGSTSHFNALKPSHPEVLRLLGDVLAEAAEVFPSPWLHVGLDEVRFGLGRGKPAWRLVRRAADPQRTGRDGYVRSAAALPGLLARTARVLERYAARARRIAATGKGPLTLPKGLVALSPAAEKGAE